MKARENPFRVSKLHDVRLRLDFAIDDILKKLEKLHRRGAIIGPHGSGKTRLLNELEKHLNRRKISTQKIFLNDRSRHVPWREIIFHSRKILLIDGAEQLTPCQWLWVRLLAKNLIITTHEAGKLPTLVKMKTSVELLKEIIRELSEENFWKFDCTELFHKHHGNIRDALRECFDQCAD